MIRFAKKEDEASVIQLLMTIFYDMDLPFLQKYGEKMTRQMLFSAMEHPDFRYHYQRGIVKEVDQQVVGIAFGYQHEVEAMIDLPFAEVLQAKQLPASDNLYTEPETFPNEWYLDTLAVHQDYQGQGIGSELLTAVNQLAIKAEKPLLGLNVDQGNPKAKKLYQRLGFEVVGEIKIASHWYDHMQKNIANN
ncbi:GNAT superfamily N-acetyltransferase [Enterococcus sp. PF1-24]|uniref:GNAT family N-acetyltransferase n=1 Tax=unclassified Enterococcus TaxID=2608891 RepID=UPI0024737C19|nr:MULTISPECIES: GNAT family N-acetyltransferase [unclassified Enterococcus]MDH6365305.1 GNAT superfamily N-acetyltransferase [Enterococcus sp. PFB1-1]MDH6402439.1 GNAT superfamily N-acetyltransferase [Enterococcus sp. PF1-24]